ncbi:Perlucin-like 2, partial [Homarus americanus]
SVSVVLCGGGRGPAAPLCSHDLVLINGGNHIAETNPGLPTQGVTPGLPTQGATLGLPTQGATLGLPTQGATLGLPTQGWCAVGVEGDKDCNDDDGDNGVWPVCVISLGQEGKYQSTQVPDSQQVSHGVSHEVGGSCYFYGYFPLNWFRAAEFCHSFGSGVSLATIETLQENYFIKKWLAVNGHHNTGVWVGGSDNGHSGKWAWFPTGQLVSYSNWGPSQPSGGDQHCMYLVGGLLGYQWADFHCEFDMHFLCEHGVNTVEPWR